jgi:hypothetical protein
MRSKPIYLLENLIIIFHKISKENRTLCNGFGALAWTANLTSSPSSKACFSIS